MTEQVVANVEGDEFARTAPGMRFPFDPSVVIELRNPQTGEAVGATMTGTDIYVALYSLYIQKAIARDAVPEPEPEPVPEPAPE